MYRPQHTTHASVPTFPEYASCYTQNDVHVWLLHVMSVHVQSRTFQSKSARIASELCGSPGQPRLRSQQTRYDSPTSWSAWHSGHGSRHLGIFCMDISGAGIDAFHDSSGKRCEVSGLRRPVLLLAVMRPRLQPRPIYGSLRRSGTLM